MSLVVKSNNHGSWRR